MNLSVIVLSLNEEAHIGRCVENVRSLANDVFVVDCFSSDRTKDKVLEFACSQVLTLPQDSACVPFAGGGRLAAVGGSSCLDACAIHFVQHAWPGTQAEQLNWALDNLPIRTKWVLRLDADEYLTSDLIAEIRAKLDGLPDEVTAVEFNLQRVFMGRMIRRGIPTVSMIRLFRYGKARCEQRLMDERMMLLGGRAIAFGGSFVDHNLNDLSWWTMKHVGYAVREAANLLDLEFGLFRDAVNQGDADVRTLGEQAAAKRRMKLRYASAPLFLRAFVYFCVRYLFRGGFLEGKEGFMWHFFQGLWYRMLVDAKVWEIKRESGGDRDKMLELLRNRYGLKV